MRNHFDVLSLKGGVGKTTISWLLARALANRHPKRPVLLIDADLLGTCIGDHLLTDRGSWSGQFNLTHLLMAPPEELEEQVITGELPIYLVPASRVWVCPSHAWAGSVAPWPAVDSHLIGALAAHETAGDWVHTVLDAVRRGLAKKEGVAPEDCFVVVDHSPGMAAVQRRAVARGEGKQAGRVLVVGPDLVDQEAARVFLDIEANPQQWVVARNRQRRSDDLLRHSRTIQIPTQDDLLHGGFSLATLPAPNSDLEKAADALLNELLR